jgi:predicted nucleic acid-binding protein
MIKPKLVLDTNILVYGINKESKYFDTIRNVLDSEDYSFFITTKTVSEFVSVFSKLKRYDIIEHEFPNILKKFKIIYPNKISIGIFHDLIQKYKPVGNRVFDIEIAAIMLSKKIENLFTINTRDFQDIKEINLIN